MGWQVALRVFVIFAECYFSLHARLSPVRCHARVLCMFCHARMTFIGTYVKTWQIPEHFITCLGDCVDFCPDNIHYHHRRRLEGTGLPGLRVAVWKWWCQG